MNTHKPFNRTRFNTLQGAAICASTLFCHSANAHVKWFIQDPQMFHDRAYFLDKISVSIVFGALLFLAFCIWLAQRANYNTRIQTLLYRPFSIISPLSTAAWPSTVLRLSVGIVLFSNILNNQFIAPNFDTGGFLKYYLSLQVILFFLLIVGQRIFSIVLVAICLSLMPVLPFRSTIDYFPELIGLGVALYFCDQNIRNNHFEISAFNQTFQFHSASFGLSALRITLGIQLIILTIHDKLLSPAYGLAFLCEYPYMNFLKLLGSNFSDDIYFVLGAGMAELCFGLLLLTNTAARVGLLLIIFFFTLTGIIINLHELIGHLPILSSALILFIYQPRLFTERSRAQLQLASD